MNTKIKRQLRRWATVMIAFMAVLFLTAATGCGDEDDCAIHSENCSSSYLQDNGLTGCCSGLTCKDSVVAPGARVCK